MRFTIVTALFAAAISSVSASPILDQNLINRAACGIASGANGIGPFNLASNVTGKYAGAGLNGNLVFGRAPYSSDPGQYYLSGGKLTSITNGKKTTAYEVSGGHVAMGSGGPQIKCSLASNCQLHCTVNGGSYNCLSSPNYQPNWNIAVHKELSGCVPFVPIAKPAKAVVPKTKTPTPSTKKPKATA